MKEMKQIFFRRLKSDINWDVGFIEFTFEKLVGYGCAGFWNFGRNTAGAVSVVTFCIVDMHWKLCFVHSL